MPATLLRHVCHYHHLVLVFFGLLGWVIPQATWLIAHLLFIPGLILTWAVNRNTCPLNNLESRLTKGVWRDAGDVEQGGFLKTLVERYLGKTLSDGEMARITYGLMGLAWTASLIHLHFL